MLLSPAPESLGVVRCKNICIHICSSVNAQLLASAICATTCARIFISSEHCLQQAHLCFECAAAEIMAEPSVASGSWHWGFCFKITGFFYVSGFIIISSRFIAEILKVISNAKMYVNYSKLVSVISMEYKIIYTFFF